jgi:hypothetical protein
MAAILAGIASIECAASHVIDVTDIGPADGPGIYAIAPNGGHVAFMGKKGARFTISVDGVEGPEFDEVLQATSIKSVEFPTGVLAMPAVSGRDGRNSPVVYSYEGDHFAYVGRHGNEYVVIRDGMEAGRGAWAAFERGSLYISFRAGQVSWAETKPGQGAPLRRLLVAGKPGPWSPKRTSVTFSPGDHRYAYSLERTEDSEEPVLIVDGEPAAYFGTEPMFMAGGAYLLTHGRAGDKAAVLVDGRPVIPCEKVVRLEVMSKSLHFAAIVTELVDDKPVDRLYIDAKLIEGSEGAKWVWFSPDERHFAAMCVREDKKVALIIDGNRTPFASFDSAIPRWSPDSLKFLIDASHDGDSGEIFVDDMDFRYIGEFSEISTSERGSHYGWTAVGERGIWTVIVDGKEVRPDGFLPESGVTFSPEGSRYGYVARPNNAKEPKLLVLDGSIVPGLTAGKFAQWKDDFWIKPVHFAFSEANKHVAYFARREGTENFSLFLDGIALQHNAAAVYEPHFTPDGAHFVWIAEEPTPYEPGSTSLVLRIDGGEVARSSGALFHKLDGTFAMDDDGTITFIAVDRGLVKRVRITPSKDDGIADLLARAKS